MQPTGPDDQAVTPDGEDAVPAFVPLAIPAAEALDDVFEWDWLECGP